MFLAAGQPIALNNAAKTSSYSPWPFRLAVALALATFPLIWVGGLVTTYDAGMAVPDWPSTYGYNLFLYPWQTWIFGPWDLFIEHGHRLLGSLVGMLAIALVVAAFFDRRKWLRFAVFGGLALVVAQGLLGGMRVLLHDQRIALIHGCVGPLFFAYAASLAVFHSRFWRESSHQHDWEGMRLARAAWFLAGLAYVQLVVGAFVRHPMANSPGVFRGALLLHLVIAGVLLAQALIFHVAALRSGCIAGRAVRWLSLLVALLVFGQIVLGGATWVAKYSWPAWLQSFGFAARHVIQERSIAQALIVTGHVAHGSLILALATIQAWFLSRRFFRAGVAVRGAEFSFVRVPA